MEGGKLDYEKSRDEERAFDEGARSRHQGKPIADCPYGLCNKSVRDVISESEVALCVEWRDGWRAAGQARRRRRGRNV